jgi:hypothetical protein
MPFLKLENPAYNNENRPIITTMPMIRAVHFINDVGC